MARRESDASFFMGLVLGIALGAGVALVLTPESGEETRARLAEKVQGARDTALNKVQDTKDAAVSKVQDTKDAAINKVQDVRQATERQIDEVGDRVEGAAEGAAPTRA